MADPLTIMIRGACKEGCAYPDCYRGPRSYRECSTTCTEMTRALTALKEAGLVIAPKEPTEKMLQADRKVFAESLGFPDPGAIYRAMIAEGGDGG